MRWYGSVIVDTGAAGTTLLLFDDFSRQHPDVFDDPRFADRSFAGVGGTFSDDFDGLFGDEFLRDTCYEAGSDMTQSRPQRFAW